MYYISGNIISGEYDDQAEHFSISMIKHFKTQSILTKDQAIQLLDYLYRHRDEEGGQVITLNDQMPLRISSEEINSLILDLEKIESHF
ncbi:MULTISPECIES: hypothetical protein [Bacillaceae]|uniref:Uncharacterized protein n=1 Tax=Bacillus infantis TaxID=324767 RepID=A0A5D4SPF7_9BACI|nr:MULTISPECIES: hypothetical protein [Bacillus]MCP1158559.1 hypothetical protein [Bacillus infantis]MDT0158847.1 hypothetical protein [Bacillus sp. AG4(2022)]MDW2878891.1 hypothetical protein [Bacillus infantis]TYS65170.1 hypothetical protein FZD47_07480 [Bacillus infantis]